MEEMSESNSPDPTSEIKIETEDQDDQPIYIIQVKKFLRVLTMIGVMF